MSWILHQVEMLLCSGHISKAIRPEEFHAFIMDEMLCIFDILHVSKVTGPQLQQQQ